LIPLPHDSLHIDDDDASPYFSATNQEQPQHHSRQTQRQAQKKSKKALRREKEDAQERRGHSNPSNDTKNMRKVEHRGKDDGMDQHSSSTRATSSSQPLTDESSSQKSCNTCGGTFVTPAEYRAHFRSDWHRYNMKLKLNHVAPISEEEFLLCDSEAFFNS
jgi:excinuclease UvrABC ATPase subunit